MKGGFSPEFLEELKYKCDIVEIVSQYIPLQKKGGRYFGCCPFHNEKTPSFCVTQASGFYHCFGCGVSGDVVKFIMEMESISFYDAVKILADKAGMALPEFKADPMYAQKKEHSEVLRQIMRDAARYYRNNLTNEEKGREAREYLANRGINDDVSARYGLGLSLDYDSMTGYMRRKGYSIADLRECGLINGERNSDAFANRIIVPIMNGMSEVIAFGGRIYHGETETAKYKNSTNTTLFDKSRTIYGINFIKKDKKESGGYKELILVEGYMDVISLGAAGIRNAVAGMGTALTDGQARELKRLVPTVYLCYDGDNAGRKAAVKNVEPLIKCGLDVKVVSLDNGKDPDETVRTDGYEGFMKKLSEALPVIEYKLKLCADAYNLNTVYGRAKYVNAAVRVLREVESRAEREVYFDSVSKLSGVSVASLESEINANTYTSQSKSQSNDLKKVADKESKTVRASRFVLNRFLNNAKYADIDLLKREWLPHPVHQQIYDYARTQPQGEINVGRMYDHIEDDEEINYILDVNLNFSNVSKESEYFFDCLMTIANEYISGRLEFLNKQYNVLSDPAEKRSAITEISDLTRKLKSRQINDKI